MADNKMINEEQFIIPINNSIKKMTEYLVQEVFKIPWNGDGTYHLLNAKPLRRLLTLQFKDGSKVFKPNMIALKKNHRKTLCKT